MRLTEPKVHFLADQLARLLEEHPQVTFKVPVGQIALRIRTVIAEDLRREDALDEEVTALLEHHLRGKNRFSIDYQALFRKAKAQMIRDRRLVI